MKIKTAELIGPALDWAVGRSLRPGWSIICRVGGTLYSENLY